MIYSHRMMQIWLLHTSYTMRIIFIKHNFLISKIVTLCSMWHAIMGIRQWPVMYCDMYTTLYTMYLLHFNMVICICVFFIYMYIYIWHVSMYDISFQYHKFMFIYIYHIPFVYHAVSQNSTHCVPWCCTLYIYMKYVTTCDTCYSYKIQIYTAYNTQSLWIQIPPEKGLNPPNIPEILPHKALEPIGYM